MPGSIQPPLAVGVFPQSLSTKFTSSRKFEGRFLEYHDGTTERASLVGTSRRTWQMSKRLTPSELATLRAWFDAHQADAFYFYDLRETSPINTYDPTGTATNGRYVVRFASDWAETIGIGRSDTSVELIELQGGGTGSTGGGGGGGGGGSTTPVFATISFITSHTPGGGYDGFASVNLGSGFVMFDGSEYYNRTDSTSWSASSGVWSAGVGPLVSASDPRTAAINFFSYGSLFGTASPGDLMYIYDCVMTVTFADGSMATLRPTTATVTPGAGTVDNPNNAIDEDPGTYALITKTNFHPLATSTPTLTLSNFR